MAWKRFQFKNNKVYAEVDESGNLVLDDRECVRICYKPGDERTYSAAARNLVPLDGVAAPARARSAPARPAGPPAERQTGDAPAPSGPRRRIAQNEDEEMAILGALPAGSSPIIAYTDGACRGNPGPAGLGVVLLAGENRRELSEYLGPRGTNNIAELSAIKRALEEIKQPERPVLIYTDSEYSLGVLAGGWRAKANRELILETRELMKRFPQLFFVKVLAHSGVELNERADALGNEAIERHHPRGPVTAGAQRRPRRAR